MLFALALIPAIVLLVVVYVNDKKEKEPFGLLVGLFFAGVGTIVSAIIIELIGELIWGIILSPFPVLEQIVVCFLVIGPAEELGKFLVLRLITWKNKNFDYSYDGIVYAVFVSLGFAAFENVGYVLQNGLGTAIMRMFTSVPGHTCFAIIMGYFYSKAKYAQVRKDKKKYHFYHTLAMLAPIGVHGLYDAFLFAGQASSSEGFQVLCVLGWIGSLIVMFVVCIILVVKSSKNDFCIIIQENNEPVIYQPKLLGTWTCTCGSENTRNFCTKCGGTRPMSLAWNCPNCGTVSRWNFCGHCGAPNPSKQGLVAKQ